MLSPTGESCTLITASTRMLVMSLYSTETVTLAFQSAVIAASTALATASAIRLVSFSKPVRSFTALSTAASAAAAISSAPWEVSAVPRVALKNS